MHTHIEFQNITKKFDELIANENINLKISKGEVHALVGENGAGKSTLMKILMGILQPNQGKIFIDGKETVIASAKEAHDLNIGMVHQHFLLANHLPAYEHFVLSLKNNNLFYNKKNLISDLEALSKSMDFSIDWEQNIENLPVGVQQKIEILKLIYQGAETLIFDEPTAVLTPDEIKKFCSLVLKMKSQGKTIVFISHKLNEIFSVSDQITVLKSGKIVGSFSTRSVTPQFIAEQMVGKTLLEVKNTRAGYSENEILLNAENLNYKNKLSNLSFQLHKGEILGIAGVDGNGQSELLKALTRPQLLKGLQGTTNFGNNRFGFVSEDRHKYSVALQANLLENFLLGQLGDRFFINWRKIEALFQTASRIFNIKFQNPTEPLSSLSGGNQQKLVMARELSQNKEILIIAQPTRGVDIGSIQLIHEKIIEAKQKGMGILLVSTELDELLKLSDRILVLFRGKNMGIFTAPNFDEKIIGQKMAGLQ